MKSLSSSSFPHLFLLLGAFVYQAHAADPLRGLWVGDVSLNAVNEATGAVGDSNTFEFTDPEITTATSDAAFLRLIVHVNGAGQASLLKSVAVVDRDPAVDSELDLLLLTDPTLYSQFPGPAKRIASAAFDFGNPQAFLAINTLIDDATDIAVTGALGGDDQATIQSSIEAALDVVVDGADVESAYLNSGSGATSFITDDFFDFSEITALAEVTASLLDSGAKTAADFEYTAADTYEPYSGNAFSAVFDTVFADAVALRDDSFYQDTRGIDAIVQIVDAAVAAVEATDPTAVPLLDVKQANALRAAEAAWHNAGDLEQSYNRFLGSDEYAKVAAALVAVAVPAAIDAELLGGDALAIETAVRDALLLNSDIGAANSAAAIVALDSVFSESDPRATRAMDTLIDAAVTVATEQALIDPSLAIMQESVGLAVDTTFEGIPASPVFASAPSEEYTAYVSSSDYPDAASQAAITAAAEASFQVNAGEDDEKRLQFLVRRAVSRALVASRNEVAAIPQDRVILDGSFVDGSTVEGTLYLPALAPTNPFLHRLHPDHSEGIAIERRISLELDNSVETGVISRAGYGATVVSGTYNEEIFGLHKALGPNQDIGLKTQGTFTLNRISLIDTLNF